jgi:4-amino-4-deoxy-L-arabinose transferase-like glycosyltransferase
VPARVAARPLAARPGGIAWTGSGARPVSASSASAVGRPARRLLTGARALPAWWPLPVLLVVAAALRLPTLSLQSFWFDEAYIPVHVLHASLGATLHSWLSSENTPPLWYLIVWAVSRVFGTGVVALRLPSALFGIALVWVGWALGAELGSRRTQVTLAAIIAVNPIFVWYSQEARAYGLYALLGGLSFLCFVRVRRLRTSGSLAWWAIVSILALLTHYFAVFLVAPEALVLLADAAKRRTGAPRPRATIAAVGAVAAAGAALVPLVIAQGGHGTQWIGRWALSHRLIAIPGYYVLGYNGAVLGHGVLLLAGLPVLAAIALVIVLAATGRLTRPERDAIAVSAGIGFCAIAVPVILALAGADYLAPRNTLAAFVPLSAALAVVLAAPGAGRVGLLLTLAICFIGLVVVIATNFDSRLQRGAWSAVADSMRPRTNDRAIVTVELGAAPLEYYLPNLRLRYLTAHRVVRVSEIDLVGYAPLRADVTRAPTPAFVPNGIFDQHGYVVYRFTSATPQAVSGHFLRSLSITVDERSGSEALVPAAVPSRPQR